MIIIISPLCLLHQDLEKTYIFVSLLRSLQHDYDKKTLFWFYRCVDYAAIIRFFLFILILRSLRHGQDEKRFSFQYSVHYDMATEKINLIFITPLLWLRSIMKKNILLFDLTFTFFHDQKKKNCFSFIHCSHCAYIFLHLLHLPVES